MKKFFSKYDQSAYQATLKNGLNVVLLPNDNFNTCSAGIVFKIGSIDSLKTVQINQKSRQLPLGVAHFLEHRMFDFKEGQVMDLFSRLGADSNAFTDFNKTAYYFTGAENYLEALELLLKFTNHFEVSKKSVENEKGIIIEELKMGLDNHHKTGFFGLLKLLYQNHLVREEVIGDEPSILKTTKEDLEFAHQHFYHPANSYLYVVGKFDRFKVLSLIKKFPFKEKERGILLENPVVEPSSIFQKEGEIEMGIKVPAVTFALKLEVPEEKQFELTINTLTVLLDSLFSSFSKGYQQMLNDKIISSTFQCGIDYLNDCFYCYFYAETPKKELFVESIKQILLNPKKYLTKGQFIAARNSAIGSSIKTFNSPNSLLYTCLLDTFLPTSIFRFEKSIKKVTLNQVKRLLSQIDVNNSSTFTINPKK